MGVYLADNFARAFISTKGKSWHKGIFISRAILHIIKKSVSYKKYAPQGWALFLGKDGECGKRRLFFRQVHTLANAGRNWEYQNPKKISPIKYRREKINLKIVGCGKTANVFFCKTFWIVGAGGAE